jgi:hypothetical protein
LVSLTFCNGWTDVQTDASGYVIRLEGVCVTVKPDPFAGGEVSIEIAARELPNGPFGSVSEAQRAFSCARTVTVTGTVSGR